ncbi:MAG: tandem-95 repeat protein, partial [Gammaproteobacteria bacterium]|nr:tandem-95 repeat protein [Gammaproteobacteria bacterium]
FDIDNALDLNSIVITGAPANGSLIVNGDGTVNYTHDGSENLSDSFSYTISDITGAISNIASVTVTVNPVNDAPLALDDNQAAVDEGGTAIFDLAANDSDAENALDLNSIDITGDPANGSVTANGDGTVSYIHDGSQTTSDSFSYTISDISGAISNVAIVNITVNPLNNAPTTIGIVDVNVTEDSAATNINLNAAFDDADNLDSELTYSITGNTNIGLFSNTAVNAVTGELVLDYAANMNGLSQISIRATDPSGASVDTLFTVTVTPVNDTPVLVANAGMTVVGTASAVISNAELSVNDIDNTNAGIVYTVTELPTNGELLINGLAATVNSSFTEYDIVNNRVSYQTDGSGTNDQFAFTVSDSAGGTISSNTFNIVVQIAPPEPEVNTTTVDPEPLPDPVVTTTAVDTEENIQSEVSAEAASEREGWYVGSNRTQPQPQQPELTLEPVSQQVVQNDFDYYQEPVQTSEAAKYNLSTATSVADLQIKSIKALWQAIDQMKQQIDRNVTEDMTQIEFRAAAVSSSGVALTAGVVAWVLRGGALMSSLMSTVPLWKAYDPLPILAYRDDEDEEKNKNITVDKIPASLEEMRKIKALKEKMKKHNQVDALFGGPGVME